MQQRSLVKRRGMLGVLALSCTSPLFAQGSVLPVKSQRMRSQIDAGQAIALDGDWSVLPLPVDFTSASDVHTRGTSLYMQTPSHVYLWSAITRSWATVAVSPTAVVTQYNAFVTIEDGNTVHAYGTRRGTVETLTFASPPQIFSGSPSSCWMAVVVSGTDAWSFGAFDGEFHHADLNAAVSTIVVGQTVALIEDGTRVLACSAYYGELKAVDLPTGATLDANGDTAVVWSPDQVHCFSAHLDTWTTRNTSGATAIDVQRGFALFGEGNDLIAYSPCTGDFATLTPPAGFQYEPGRYVAAVHAGTELWAYSSGQNRFVARTLAGAANLQISDEVLVVEDGTETVAFSVTSGAFSDALPGSFTASTNAAMVWAQDGSQGRALDIVHGTWSSPVSLAGNPSIQVLRNLVVLVNPGATAPSPVAAATGRTWSCPLPVNSARRPPGTSSSCSMRAAPWLMTRSSTVGTRVPTRPRFSRMTFGAWCTWDSTAAACMATAC
ncbi:MAG: hypothetical protein R3E96_10270 [Planctomycetota bacterium]